MFRMFYLHGHLLLRCPNSKYSNFLNFFYFWIIGIMGENVVAWFMVVVINQVIDLKCPVLNIHSEM